MMPGRLAVLAVLCLPLIAHAQTAPWPTVHKDNQRSGYTERAIAGPYERKWFRDFHDQMIATRVEAILAEGKCYIGTFSGDFHALNIADGKTAWTFHTAGPIGASALYRDGRIYVGSDDGYLYCLNAADGNQVWKYKASASVWVAPATDGKAIYFGDRAGVLHAVDATSGQKLWTYRTDYMILTPASISADASRIVFGSEDMHVYCVSPEGKLIWKSAKLNGLSMRDHAPVIWQNLAIVTTNPAISFHQAAGENPAILTQAQKALPVEPEDKIIQDKWGTYSMKLTPRRLAAERKAILAFLDKNPQEKTFYAFDLESGREPWTVPVLYTAGLHNPPTPPTFNPHTGDLYLWVPTALSNYSAGVPGGAIAVGRLDRKTGLVDILWHTNGDKVGWAFDFVAPADETQSLSLMGGILLNTHQGIIGGMRLDNLKWHKVYIARDTYGGIFGPAVVPGSFQGADKVHANGQLALMANEWHGPDRSVVSIGDGRLFWVAGSQVVCIGGPDTPKTDTGGTKAPPPIQRKRKPATPAGNVANANVGAFDDSIAKPVITPEQLSKYLAAPAAASGRGSEEIRAQLNAVVLEAISTGWSPLIVELGISGEDRYFWRTAETMQILALAAPRISPEVRQKLVAFLSGMFARGCPLQEPVFTHAGQPREPYTRGPVLTAFANATSRYSANIEDLYAVWAYAHYADGWERVLTKLDAIGRIFDAFAAKPAQFDHADKDRDAAEHLNGQIAGVLAYARIMQQLKKDSEVDRAMKVLAELVSMRVHHELADTRFVRSTRTASKGLHQAKIPRYLALTPEVGHMLHDFAGDALKRNVESLARDLPVWHHAFGERLIGGENYISPSTLARGLFMAQADGVQTPPQRLVSRLDQPWCKADLYYIEKLTAILRATARQP